MKRIYGLCIGGLVLAGSAAVLYGSIPLQIETGMHRSEVIKMLGPATWVSLPGDKGLFKPPEDTAFQLRWKQKGCVPIVVSFDADSKVVMKDMGTWWCQDGYQSFEPGQEISCDRVGRKEFCK